MSIMSKYKKEIGLIFGLSVAAIIWNLNLEGISPEGQQALALTIMTVIFWATKVANPGFTSLLYLVSLVLLKVAPAAEVFSLWSSPTAYLIIGAYLISDAVENSGLGQRVAYVFILKFVNSFRSIIVSTFVLQIILGAFIPHPWPRAFLILSVMKIIIETTNIKKDDGRIIGFSVFAAAVPTSLIYLTADTSNVIAIEFSGTNLGWLGWFLHMGIPALASSLITCLLILYLFKPSESININKIAIKEKLEALGSLNTLEKKTIFWLLVAIILWTTDSIHGISLGWVTIFIAVLMSLPTIGGLLNNETWKLVPMDTMFFLTGAIAISRVGNLTGMNDWIAKAVLPAQVPDNIFLFAILVAGVSMIIHMFLGSVTAVIGIVIPAFLSYTANTDMNPLVPVLIAFISVATHYLLPHQHMNMLVGMGEEFGMYDETYVLKLGLPLTLVVFVVVLFVQIPWWHITGLL